MSGPTLVNVPGVGQVSFPGSMSDADIENAIKTNIVPQAQGQAEGESRARAGGVLPYVDNLVRQAANGATLGYADELSAGLNASLKTPLNYLGLGDGTNWAQRYAQNIAQERAQDKTFKEENPIAATTANVAGNVATGMLALPEIPVAGSMLGNAVRYGTAGGALGAVQGFGEGEGNFSNRLGEAGKQGAIGAIGGAVVPVAGQMLRKGADVVAAPLLRKAGSALESVAPKVTPNSLSAAAPEGGQVMADSMIGRLADALTGKADSIETNSAIRNLAAKMAEQKSTGGELTARLAQLGPNATLADLGPSFLSAANGGRLESPEVRNLAQKVMTDRARQYTPMLTDAFTGGADVPSLYEAGRMFGSGPKDIGAYPRQVGADLYGAMRAQGLNTSPEMQAIIDKAPDVRDAIAQITEQAAGKGKTLNPIDVMDRVKRQLNLGADAAFNSGKAVNKADVGELADQFERAFFNANPTAETASHGYANASALRDYVDLGRRFMSEGTTPGQLEVSSEAVRDQLARALANQNTLAPGAYTLGVQNAGRAAAQAGPTAFARKLAPEAEGIYSKLAQALGTPGADRVMQAADAVRTFQGTANKLTGGSSSIPNLADAAALGNARLNLGKSGITERLTEHLSDLIAHAEEPTERVTGRMGELLLTPNQHENQDVINRLAQILARHSRSAGARAAAASSAGHQLTGGQ